MLSTRKRIAVIGAGPIGLEAALLAAQSGFAVDVYEAGSVANNVIDWGHVRLFSPLAMNVSPWGVEALAAVGWPGLDAHRPTTLRAVPGGREAPAFAAPGHAPLCPGHPPLPPRDALLTGREFAEAYLLPLSRLPDLEGRVHEGVHVRSVGRRRTWKTDAVGDPRRERDPFQLLLADARGERVVEADVVFDCSGTYPAHNWIGAGGVPCPGERPTLAPHQYLIPDITGEARREYAGRRTLVIGAGHSAATAVVALAGLAKSAPGTQVAWITRSERRPPLVRIDNDPLPERDRLAVMSNELALAARGPVEWLPQRLIRGMATRAADEAVVVTTESIGADGRHCKEDIVADRVIANVGYRPETDLHRELHVQQCYATEGPIRLAAKLLGETSADCTRQRSHGAETLCHPEPGFFILGSKSYGRDSRFLLKTGIEQVREVMEMLRRTDRRVDERPLKYEQGRGQGDVGDEGIRDGR